jgi:Fic family protein
VNGRQLVSEVLAFRADAQKRISARRGSAAWRIVDLVTRQPVINAQAAAAELGVTEQNAQASINRLVGDGVLSQIGSGQRNRLYQADAMLAALDAFAQRARRWRHQGG